MIHHIVQFALRQRVHDLRPKSVDFLPGTPEENLAYFRTRVRRFEQLRELRGARLVGPVAVAQVSEGGHDDRGTRTEDAVLTGHEVDVAYFLT